MDTDGDLIAKYQSDRDETHMEVVLSDMDCTASPQLALTKLVTRAN